MNVPDGLCQCGCGAVTAIAKKTNKKYGAIKGKPNKFIPGHQGRKSNVAVWDADNGCFKVALSRGLWALVDIDRIDVVMPGGKWVASTPGRSQKPYARRGLYGKNRVEGKSYQSMHRLIAAAADDDVVDHINGDTLDNRRSNLRIVTTVQNNQNRIDTPGESGYVGVHATKKSGKFRARVTHGGRNISLGTFDTAIEAARVRDDFVKKVRGEFAVTNKKETR